MQRTVLRPAPWPLVRLRSQLRVVSLTPGPPCSSPTRTPPDGPSNRSKVLVSATPQRALGVDASPFNVLLLHAAVASDMVRAAPAVPVLPWVEPDTTTEHDGLATLRPIWPEHLFHLTLRLGARRFLWWRAGRDQPLSRGMATASAALHELDTVMDAATAGAWVRRMYYYTAAFVTHQEVKAHLP